MKVMCLNCLNGFHIYFEITSAFLGLGATSKKIESAEDFGNKFELFFTGTVESIRKKKYYRHLDSGKCCDKCGKPINRYSWFSFCNKTLCDDCDKELQKEYNREHQLNKIKDYPVTGSSAYWTVYLNTRSGKEDIIMPEDILD